jgi:superfamily II RNA helicase
MLEIGERLFDIQTECGLDLSRHDYLKNLNFGLVEVVYEWARGMVRTPASRRVVCRVVCRACRACRAC